MDQKNRDKALKILAAVIAGVSVSAAVTAFLYFPHKGIMSNIFRTASSSLASNSADSSAVKTVAAQEQQLHDWRLVLVNYSHKMPDNFQHVIVNELGVEMDSRIIEPYKKMRDAAAKDNITLWISSGYRSPEKQQALFEQEINSYYQNGVTYADAITKAESSVAKAGYSEHNTGLALDLNGVREDFGGTPASNWLQAHSAEYGFVLRYPADKQSITKIKYEPWHYRYVGVQHAKEMNRLHMCLEEYVDYFGKKEKAGD